MTQLAKTPGGDKHTDKHVHLAIVENGGGSSEGGTAKPPPWDWARWPTLAAGAAAVGFFVASFFTPWWQFMLYAPQYPKGLQLIISLTGMSGDVSEIDLLNHYIGMKHLAGAAPTERHLAGFGVAAICVLTLALLTIPGKKLSKLAAVPAITFPIVFIADSFYWLYTFGHRLDPHAPLHIGAFTPQMFGNGNIGQFETFAHPGMGFWLAVAGVTCAVVATVFRTGVCKHCSSRGTCTAICPRLTVLKAPKSQKAA